MQNYDQKLPVLKSKEEVETWRESVAFDDLTPWYQQYRAVVTKYLGVSEHETFNHPVARMNV